MYKFKLFFHSLLLTALLAASTLAQTWVGNAAAVKQISTITVANTWATADTGTVTINGKALVVTVGTAATTADVAEAISDAINASTRLDGTGSPDATSNFGGHEFGEFAELTASASGSVVTLIGDTAGKPFVFAVSESTAGSGTLAAATPQAATGPNFWDNAKNWNTGSVPVNDALVIFRDSDVDCTDGLPNGSLEVTLNVYQSYSGEIGRPAINRDNPSLPYVEYRQRYARFDDAGTGTDIAHRFGLGNTGNGATLINVKHSTVKCSPVVFATGTAQITGTKALNICCTANTSTLNILGGSVDWGSQDGSTTAFVTVKQTGGDSIGVNGLHTSGAVLNVSGGTAVVGGTGAIANIGVSGGELRIENQTGSINGLAVTGGTVDYISTAEITAELYVSGGTFDASVDAGPFETSGSVALWPGSTFLDPLQRMDNTGTFTIYFNPSTTLQIGGSASGNGIGISY